MRDKARHFRVVNPIYGYTIHVRVSGGEESACEWASKKLGTKFTGSGQSHAFVCLASGKTDHCIWIESKSPSACVLSHECLHSVKHAMESLGVGSLCDANEEAYTYFLQWTVSEILKRI